MHPLIPDQIIKMFDIVVQKGPGLCSCVKGRSFATSLEPVVSELRRGLEGFEPQCSAGVNSLFGAVQGLAASRPAQVDEGRVGRVEGRYTERGKRGRAVSGARGGAGGGKGSQEGVEG